MKLRHAAAAASAILLLSGCGGGENVPDQPSAEERRALDNIAAKQDAESAETFDTSPDSLVPAEGSAAATNEVTPANSAAPNSAAPNMANTATGNNAAPR